MPIRGPADLQRYPLIHFDWFANDRTAPNWQRWFAMATTQNGNAGRDGGAVQAALSFRELHAIEAAAAGQGVALLSDILVADELASGALVKVLDLAHPRYGFYPL